MEIEPYLEEFFLISSKRSMISESLGEGRRENYTMKIRLTRTIELGEYASTELDAEALPEESAIALWQALPAQIIVDFPSPKTGNRLYRHLRDGFGRFRYRPTWFYASIQKLKFRTFLGCLNMPIGYGNS